MIQDSNMQAFQPAATFPRKHVVGAVADLHEAEQAIQALKKASYIADDVHLFPSQAFITMFIQSRQRWNWLQWMIHCMGATTDEGFAGDWYLEEARQRHHILAVRTSNEEQVEQVRTILAGARAHRIKYIGPWAITNLPS